MIKKIALFAMFLALCWLLPLLTGQIKEIGNMLCPMHIPVLLCGFILKEKYGTLLGLIAPLTRSLLFGMPPLYPTALCMSIELAIYGFVSGFLFKIFVKKFDFDKNLIFGIYLSLIIAMLLGRIAWGFTSFIIGLIQQSSFTFKAFITYSLINAWPGILIQLILIPLLIFTLCKSKQLQKLY